LDRLCHVSPEEGCNEDELKRALLANNVQVDEWFSVDRKKSVSWLARHCAQVGPAIICVDSWEHWCTVLSVAANHRWVVFDPSRNHGVEIHDDQSLLARWECEDGIYGVGIGSAPQR
jgi:hypothetical protein